MSAQKTNNTHGGSNSPHIGAGKFLWALPPDTPLENLAKLHELYEQGVDVTDHPLTRGGDE